MVSYQYLKCRKCGRITRVLTYSVYWSSNYCPLCGDLLLAGNAVTKQEYLNQRTISYRDSGESPGIPREKIGVPIAKKSTPRKETVETTFWYAVEE